MGNLASTQLNTSSDPDVVRRQILAEREKQLSGISNPQQQLAARLGGLLGGGLVNLYQDKGFFEVNDPLLTKVTQIQGIYNDVASRVDPAADPAKFFGELQKAYGDAGLGREALAAAQEAQKAKTTNMDFQLKETQLFEKNPELLAGRISTALEQGNEPEAMRLANLNARLTEDRDLKLEKARTDIAKDKAYITYQNKLAEQGRYKVERADPNRPELGWVRFDLASKNPLQSAESIAVPASLADKYTAPAKDTKKSDKEKAPLNSFETNTTTPPAAAPAASSAAAPAAPVAAPQVDPSTFNPAAYNQNAGTYRLDADPIVQMIADYAKQNRQLLETNTEFRNSITAAYENRKQELARMMGTGVRFQ